MSMRLKYRAENRVKREIYSERMREMVVMKLCTAVFAILSLAGGAFAAMPAKDTLIAHRGECGEAPENTLPAYRLAVERGFGFECDVYLSKDGRVFTLHDNNFKSVTGGACTNRCGDLAWSEIEKMDVGNWGRWKGSVFAGTRPALLEEVLELARNGRMIVVEVKTGPVIVPAIKKVFDRQRKANPRNVMFIAFDRNTCRALKQQMPEYKTCCLFFSRKDWWTKASRPWRADEVLAAIRYAGADGVDFQYTPEITTEELIGEIRKAGYEFHVWTVDRLEDTIEAFRRGAMTVTTNCAKRQYDAWSTAEKMIRHSNGSRIP